MRLDKFVSHATGLAGAQSCVILAVEPCRVASGGCELGELAQCRAIRNSVFLQLRLVAEELFAILAMGLDAIVLVPEQIQSAAGQQQFITLVDAVMDQSTLLGDSIDDARNAGHGQRRKVEIVNQHLLARSAQCLADLETVGDGEQRRTRVDRLQLCCREILVGDP